MHANKTFNRNPTNHKLYHALLEALIEDENAMDKGVADIVKDHKRKHDNDDEGPPARPNQGNAPSKDTKTGKSASAKEPVEEPITEVVMDDASEYVVRDDDQPQDTPEPKTTKTPNSEWFTQPLRPLTYDLEWNKLGQLEQPWFNQMVFATKDPLTFNDLMATLIDFSKYVLNRLKIDNLTQDILLGRLIEIILKEVVTPFDLSKPLPLQGHLGHLTVAADYFFNNDLEYLKSFDLERTYTMSITKTKSAQYELKGIEDMVPTL
nr:hypothetical protein [Tanacetum cinerariifolium]